MTNEDKVILHLCCSELATDSLPYAKAGYTVLLWGLAQGRDVRLQKPPRSVYGIIANPPCTDLAGSGARWWKEKGDQALYNALAIADACCRLVLMTNPHFWMIENPVGRLKHYLGEPVMYYQPYEYGDPYTKKTCLWGKFNPPKKKVVEPTLGSKMHRLPPSPDRQTLRSVCSPGFAQAFFEANQ